MPSILLTPPAAEPLTLAEAKDWLRVEHNDDDALITSLVAAARARVEIETRRALIAQTWRIVRDDWPGTGRIDVLPAPLRQLVAVRVYDSAGVAHALSLDAFAVNAAAAPATIAFSPRSIRQPGRAVAGVEIDVEVGYGASAAAVPAPLTQAVRLLLAHWCENAEA